MVEWPDWSGETAIVVGTSSSAATSPLETAKDRARFIAIKSAWKLAPWADVLYGIDKGWWIANHGVPKFQGLKVTPSPTVCKVYRDVRQVSLRPRAEILMGEVGVLGCGLRTGGGHSGFQAINLAVQFGAKRIVLVGFDMTLRHGAHWSGDYRGVAKPDAKRISEWREAFDACADQFPKLGVEVVNASSVSALRAYPKVNLEDLYGRPHARRTYRSRSRTDLQGGTVSGSTIDDTGAVRGRTDSGSEGYEPRDPREDTASQSVG